MKKFTKLFVVLITSLFISNSGVSATYYLQTGGTITNTTHWWSLANATGTHPVFTANNIYNLTSATAATKNTALTLSASWAITSGSTVNFGPGSFGFTLTLTGGGKIGPAISPAVNLANLSVFIIDNTNGVNMTASKTNYNVAGSTVILTVNTAAAAFSDTYRNLTINDNLQAGADVTVNGILSIANGMTMDIGSANAQLFLGGTIDGSAAASGSVSCNSSGTEASNIIFTGNGAIGQLNLTSGLEYLLDLRMTTSTATSTVTLGSYASVAGTFSLTNGILNATGQRLDLLGPVTATSGSLACTSSSSLHILGAGVIGNMNFAPTNATVGVFDFSRLGETITMQQNVTVSDSVNFTDGTLALGSNLLTLNGPITVTSGSITSSNTSSLTIGGAGTITGSLPITSSIYDLTLNRTGQILTLASPLDIINSITPTAGTIATGGNVTLKNNAATKSRIGIVGATAAITGNLTVENYIPGSVAGWRTLGAPGISGLTVASWDGGSGSATGFAMTCSGCTNGVTATAGQHFVSIQGDAAGTNTTYQELTSADALTPGKGIWVYDGNSLTTAIPVTQTKSGTAVTGNVPATSKFTSNPYACPLSVAAITPVFGVVQYFDPVLMAMTPILAGSIPAGQGFYSANVGTFTEAHKDVTALTTATSIYKLNSTHQTNTNSIGKIFKLKIDGFTGDGDYTYIRLHPDATSSYDSILDAKKMYITPGYYGTGPTYSQYTSIASVNSNQDYCVNSLPDVFTSNLVIPIVAKAQVTGQYTISPIDIQNLPGTACVSLKDKLLNINHDLRAGSYICNIADTTAKPRFELTICYDPNVVTGINQYENLVNEVLIGQNGTSGAFIKTKFDKTTKSIVSAYNVMGQKVMADKEIEGSENLVYLDFNNVNSQLVIIKVTNDKGQTTKKVFIN